MAPTPTPNPASEIKNDDGRSFKVEHEKSISLIVKSSASKPMEKYNERSVYQRLANLEAYRILKGLDEYQSMVSQVSEEFHLSDLGCSHGYNTITLYKSIISDILATRPELNFRIHLNDLPSNDFNSVFQCLNDKETSYHFLPPFQSSDCSKGPKVHTFVNGSSFYQNLLPSNSQDLITSFWTLHWLPKTLPLTCSTHPNSKHLTPTEHKDYEQIAEDCLTEFLICRAQELKLKGILAFNVVEFFTLTDTLESSFQQFITTQGMDIHSFSNLVFPVYWRSKRELETSLEKVQHQFRLVKYVKLTRSEVNFDFPSVRAVVYNNYYQGLKLCQIFEKDEELTQFLEEFMEVLQRNCPEIKDPCTLAVLQKIA